MSKTVMVACIKCGVMVRRTVAAARTGQCACQKCRRKVVVLPCLGCGELVELSGIRGLAMARKNRPFCGQACLDQVVRRESSERMRRTNLRRRHIIKKRMKADNPMFDDTTRVRMASTLKSIGHGPKKRGGNGKGPTKPQRLLADALGWPMEFVIPTRKPRASGYPTHYKIDIASEANMVAIEVDGYSHCARKRQAQDRKKEAFLRGLGWTVLRFSNVEVMASVKLCVDTVTSTISKSRACTPMSPTDS